MNTNKHNSLITASSLNTVSYDQLSVPKLWLAEGNNSCDTFQTDGYVGLPLQTSAQNKYQQ